MSEPRGPKFEISEPFALWVCYVSSPGWWFLEQHRTEKQARTAAVDFAQALHVRSAVVTNIATGEFIEQFWPDQQEPV